MSGDDKKKTLIQRAFDIGAREDFSVTEKKISTGN